MVALVASDVIELKNNRIRFTTVYTRMFKKVIPQQNRILLSCLLVPLLCFELIVPFITLIMVPVIFFVALFTKCLQCALLTIFETKL